MVCTPPTHREAGSLFKLLTAVAAQLKHHVGKKPRDSPQNPWQWRDCTQDDPIEAGEHTDDQAGKLDDEARQRLHGVLLRSGARTNPILAGGRRSCSSFLVAALPR